jgi:hypothetical protein
MATVTKGRTFTSGETVTPAKLNNLVDLATVTDIQTADIADGQVTTAKIADANVTTAKIADANVTTAKIADANVTTAKLSQPFTLATSVATTSGTAIDFTSIPSWVKRITFMLHEISTNGTSNYLLQLGHAGGVQSSGYVSLMFNLNTSASVTAATASQGVVLQAPTAATLHTSVGTVTKASGNTWIVTHQAYRNPTTLVWGVGRVTLSDALDRVRLTTANGTDAFDSGFANIMYEG